MDLSFGSTIGILGGGQLSRMLAMAAAKLGYQTIIFDPDANAPARQVASDHVIARYDDEAALAAFAARSDVVTYEFENVPVAAAKFINALTPVRPGAQALEVAQDRLWEKKFLNEAGIETAPFMAVNSAEDLAAAMDSFEGTGVLKTRRMGYDGKGQQVLKAADPASAADIYTPFNGVPLILEGFVPFEREISVIAARGLNGAIAVFDPAENVHREGTLYTSTVPAKASGETLVQARKAAQEILEALEYVGVIGVEFFVMANGGLIANEIAPRVHNSGHWTEAACANSQFEQHIRAITGLPLGDPVRHSDCVMENLIGDEIGQMEALCAESNVVVHHYGKLDIRAGRKMGHFTRLSNKSS